jgi:hypothetical protein
MDGEMNKCFSVGLQAKESKNNQKMLLGLVLTSPELGFMKMIWHGLPNTDDLSGGSNSCNKVRGW